ncbi:NAD kinase [Comamonas sp. NLF-1-9]|uniref:NAD kinase n=1 Tax=Comamonas sp. NLF-1-9 TaxID=2853163 RepID=UPI001C47E79E|nr:NAD kinase [Comamonas sp. NLF-1-9]QXL85570.1 NAD kinase [Comamonas sp. NLF-1-9]
MQSIFHRIAVIGKYQKSRARSVPDTLCKAVREIAAFALQHGCEVALDDETAVNVKLRDFPTHDLDAIGRHCDLALVVGGDGTMLSVGRRLARHGTPLIGINQGRLGFITDIALEGFEAMLAPMLEGAYEEDVRPLMHGSVLRGRDCVFEALALNDVVVNRGSTSGMVELRIEVDGDFVANQRADGVIVASPTGSTAYALSAGGPMLHPSIPGWVLVPIAPHTLTHRPIVLPDAAEVAIELLSKREASANFDMQSLAQLKPGDRVLVRRSPYSACFLHPVGWSYFATLRSKLRWNEGGS